MISSSLVNDISQFVKSVLRKSPVNYFTSSKVIHDPILGTNLYQPHEIATVDLPFCQRLRNISQTDVASLVFPSANHNRLEHSLGVTAISGRIIENLKHNHTSKPNIILPEVETAIRTAAILHDIGQGPFSHLTDEIIKELPEVMEYHYSHQGIFAKHKPHEMLSYLIVKDSYFQKYLKDTILTQHESSKNFASNVDIDSIADMIVAAGQKK
jgi:HD superfamily phosphohydrolase